MSCTVCHHPERKAIDQALLDRTAALAALGKKYGLSTSALHRHKQHLLKKMAQTQNRFQDILREGCLFILNFFLQAIMHVTRTAAAEGNIRLLLQAARQGTAVLKFMHKLELTLDPDTVHRLLDAPPWDDQDSLLPADLKVFAGSRQALADSLFSFCPDPASDQDQAPGAGLGDADLAELADPDLLQNLLSGLTQSLGLPGFDLQPPRREKSGKKPKKDRGSNGKTKQNQYDTQCEKNAGKSLPAPPESHPEPAPRGHHLLETWKPKPAPQDAADATPAWLQAIDEGRLDFDTLNAIGTGRLIDLDLPGAPFFLPSKSAAAPGKPDAAAAT